MHAVRTLAACLLCAAMLLPARSAIGTAVPADASRERPAVPMPRHDEAVDAPCGLSPEAARLAELIRAHPQQRRARLRCSGVLAAVASEKAAEMARQGRVTHTLGVVPPNRRLRKAGYRLPPSYPGMDANQVEAVGGGFPTPEHALQAFLASTGHRAHLLAEHPFYAEQDEIGVGFARNPDTEYQEFWVVYIARRASGGNPPRTLHAAAGKADLP